MTGRPPLSPPATGRRRRESILLWAVLALIGWLYFSDALITTGGAWDSDIPIGLYGLQTEAWHRGQLHFVPEPDPRLAELANPYAGYQGIPRLHDASYLHGKYYMYFGVTPVALLQLPWRGATGRYLADALTTAIFSFLGVALAAIWLNEVRRRHFPGLNSLWPPVFVLTLALGSPLFAITSSPTFYTVPISTAFFCGMLMLNLASRAAWAADWRHGRWYLAGASLMAGLAVGARPVYVLAGATMLFPFGQMLLAAPVSERRARMRSLAAALVAPIGTVAALLALHNYLRFDSPFEFGMRYAVTGADITAVAIMGTKYFFTNCEMYFLRALDLTQFFPFYFNGTRPYGVLLYVPLAGLGLALPALTLTKRHDFVASALAVATLGLLNFAVLAMFHWSETRYMVDFTPALLLAGSLSAFVLIERARDWRAGLRWVTCATLIAVTAWTLLAGLFIGVSAKSPRPLYLALERGSNTVAAFVERISGVRYGPLHAEVEFASRPAGVREPLLSTGGLNSTGDIIYVRYESPTRIRVGFFHPGAGGPESRPVEIVPGRRYALAIELGSLLPAPQHPFWRGADPTTVTETRRMLSVRLDGQKLLEAPVDTYPSTSNRVFVGSNPIAGDVSAAKFSGRISDVRRGAITLRPPANWPQTGAVRLRITLPPEGITAPQPLVATGRSGSGDLIVLRCVGPREWRFGHDSWGGGLWESPSFTVSEAEEHVIEIHMLPITRGQPGGTHQLYGPLLIRFDGRAVAQLERPFNRARADEVYFGYNSIGASSGVAAYSGSIVSAEPIPATTTIAPSP
ncbi:MAG: hypothetical protein HZA32_18790 [Opitutae bacterium]|nr:hypothetical protein [Opitutae bacterium]